MFRGAERETFSEEQKHDSNQTIMRNNSNYSLHLVIYLHLHALI